MSVKTVDSRAAFQQLLKDNTYVALQATATWCGPCKAITPLFNKHADALALDGRYAFARFDIDDVADLAQDLGLASVPAFFFFEKEEVADKVRGAVPPALKKMVEEYSNRAKAASQSEFSTSDDF